MTKRDFSIRVEVEAMLENINMKMTEDQMDKVVDEIVQYDTLLSIIGLFVAKGIRDMCENEKIEYNQDEINHQINECSRMINPNDLINV